eukprot:scaffold24495_cov86-Phaeocystis_antarctica.AAC.2
MVFRKSSSLSPQKTPTSNFISGGLRQPTNLQRGRVVSGHNKNRVFSPFSGHTGTTEPHFFSSGPSSVLLTFVPVCSPLKQWVGQSAEARALARARIELQLKAQLVVVVLVLHCVSRGGLR